MQPRLKRLRRMRRLRRYLSIFNYDNADYVSFPSVTKSREKKVCVYSCWSCGNCDVIKVFGITRNVVCVARICNPTTTILSSNNLQVSMQLVLHQGKTTGKLPLCSCRSEIEVIGPKIPVTFSN